jgi:polysaccharide export outer membrane protein
MSLAALRVAMALAVLMLAGASVVARQSPAPVEYKFGFRDVLTVKLIDQDPKYSADVTVRPDGNINLLLIEDIRAAGRTTIELKQALTIAYAKYFKEPVVVVTPKEFHSVNVYISGEVPKSGEYPWIESMDILHLIAIAGGLNSWADKENILLIRKEPLPNGQREKISFNYKTLSERGSKDKIPLLMPGDQVIVR